MDERKSKKINLGFFLDNSLYMCYTVHMNNSRRGYFGIGVENLKKSTNLGTLWRSAYNLGAQFIFVIGRRYEKQSSDTVKAWRHIPLFQYENTKHFLRSRPRDCKLIGVEINEQSKDLRTFVHPERAIYLLGPEDGNLSCMDKCQYIVKIQSRECLNVSVAGSIIMYDRSLKRV